MLQITIEPGELWDERTNEFVTIKPQTLTLEHSLVSLSKWESKWNKAFLSKVDKTNEEMLDYIKCMTLTQNVNPDIYNFLSAKNIQMIKNYIEAPMTATVLAKDRDTRGGRETVTSEVIYYWMIALNIPFECQKWHLNRLLTLVRVCNVKNSKPKKRGKRDVMSQYAALNEARRKKLNTRG